MNIHFASAWLRAFITSPDDVLAFYAEDFEHRDPPQERFIRADKRALARAVRPLSNRDPDNGLGIHHFEVLDYVGDQNSGLVHWRWQVRNARHVFGLPAQGRSVETTGTSFHRYRDGKIIWEIVYSDQIHVALQLGLAPRLTLAASRHH